MEENLMSVLIRGMEMPKNCFDCPLAMQDYTTLFGKNFSRTRNSYACVLTHKTITSTKRNRFCPLNTGAQLDEVIGLVLEGKAILITNCPNCGAPVNGITCEYCGTKFKLEAE